MPKRVDVAYVEYLPDFSAFDQAATRAVDSAMQHIERTVSKSTDKVSHSFDAVNQDIESVFNDIARTGEIDFNEVVRVAQRAAETVGVDFQAGGEIAERSFDELQHDAFRNMDQIQAKARTTAAESSKSFSILGLVGSGALLGVGTAAVAGLGALSAMGLKSAASLEQTQISFNALLGSAAEGQKVFKDLQQFANVTPFTFPDVAAAGKRFLAFHDSVGLASSALQDYLTTIGNVVSVTGGSGEAMARISLAIGQIGSTSKVTLDNLNQIADAIPGFSPIAAIAKNLGQTTAETMQQISSGALPAAQGVQALLKGMKDFPGAAGAMEMQSKTLLGVFSTFSDTVGQALANAFAPAVPAIKDALVQLTPILGEALKQIAPLLGQIISGFGPLISVLVNGLVPILKPILESIITLLSTIEDSGAVGDLAGAFGEVLDALKPLMPVIGQLLSVFAKAMIPVIEALAPIIADLAPVLVDVLTALLPLIPPLAELVASLLTLVEPLIKVIALLLSWVSIEALTPLIKLLAIALTGLAEGIAFVAAWINKINWGAVGDSIKHVWNNIVGFFKDVGKFFTDIPKVIVAGLKALPTVIGKMIDGVLQAIGFGIGLIIGAFVAFPGLVIQAIVNFPKIMSDFFTGLWNDVTKLWNDHIDQIITFVTSLPHRIVDGLKAGWHDVTTFFSDALAALGRFASNTVSDIVGFFTSLPSRLSSFGGQVGSGILDWLKGRLNAVIKGVNDGIANVDDALPGISLPRLPLLAQGGIAFGPAIIGENAATGPEAAIPLGDSRAMSALVTAFQQAQAGGGAAGASSNNFTVIVEIDGEQMNARIVRVINDNNRALKRTVNSRR